MSRTVKGAKGPGYEYWSRRPGNLGGSQPGSATKRVTTKLERAASKRELQELRGAK
jgi:hypothetical protein